MSSITIRNLDDDLKKRLRIRSAHHGRSMEDEARDILRTTLSAKAPFQPNLAESIRQRFRSLGGVELVIPPREPMREPLDFGR